MAFAESINSTILFFIFLKFLRFQVKLLKVSENDEFQSNKKRIIGLVEEANLLFALLEYYLLIYFYC
jgi:hypothetical protein